jgi:hypothetical protein
MAAIQLPANDPFDRSLPRLTVAGRLSIAGARWSFATKCGKRPRRASPAYRPKVEAAWRAGHDRIAALSTRGDNTIIPSARHYIQIDQPQAVVDAVRRVVAMTGLK